MRVLKPDWIRHGDDGSSDSEPVYSIDLDRSGHRLATAALDNSIRIWSMTPLRAMEKRGVITRVENAVSTSPQLLCAMRKHQGSVNCVRWSPSGNMLASASDDHSVILWTMDNNAGTMSGESWRCSKILRQHTGDVMGVAWSPDGQFLASCSIDNTICLWNMETMTLEATLRGHNGPVKGVVWDPVRRYLASQGDDKKVIIWNVGTWKQRSSVTRPFDALGTMSTMFLRPAWTADGSYVVCPRAQSNGFPIAAGIDREGFAENETSNFVGHELPVSCARANPMLFWRRRSCDNSAHRPRAAEDVTSFLALGGEDGALSVWDAASPRALMALQHVCDHGILDLAWSSDGMELLACSQDGSVVYVQFEEDELGERVSRADQERIWRDTYGGSASGSTAIVAENVAQLRLEKARGSDTVPAAPPNAREGGSAAAVRGGGAAGPQPVQPPPRAPLAQVESRKDGKRRIAPCLVSSPNGGAIMATQFRPAANGFASATAGSTGALGSAGHGFSSADSFHSRGPEVLPVMQVQDVTHVMSPGRPDPAAAAAGGKRRRMQAPSDATGAGAVGGGADGMTSSADGARTVRLAGMAPPLSGKLSAEVRGVHLCRSAYVRLQAWLIVCMLFVVTCGRACVRVGDACCAPNGALCGQRAQRSRQQPAPHLAGRPWRCQVEPLPRRSRCGGCCQRHVHGCGGGVWLRPRAVGQRTSAAAAAQGARAGCAASRGGRLRGCCHHVLRRALLEPPPPLHGVRRRYAGGRRGRSTERAHSRRHRRSQEDTDGYGGCPQGENGLCCSCARVRV
eukprot:m.1275071 g.1275071  ORF g.1275071 m.1275071 type:complete len:796 (+) comp24760_c1_seq7:169-2556(+)